MKVDLKSKIVVYLNSKNLDNNKLAGIFSRVIKYDSCAVVTDDCSNEAIDCFKKDKRIIIKDVKEFITSEFLGQVDSYSMGLAKVISGMKIQDLLYNNINLGDVIDHELYGRYFDIIEDIFILDKVITAESPDMLIVYADLNRYSKAVMAMIEKKHRVAMFIISSNTQKYYFSKFREKILDSLSLFINIYALSSVLKYLFYQLNRGFLGQQSKLAEGDELLCDGVKPFFALDNSNASYVDTVMPLFDRFKTKSFITDDLSVVKIFSSIKDSRTIYVSLYKPMLNIKFISHILHFFKWKNVLRKSEYTISGYNLCSLLLKDFNYIVTRRFPSILASITAIGKILRTEPCTVVVLPSQCSEFEEVLIKMASNSRIPSLVIQHGILGRPFGFTPIITTEMAVWGERDKLFLEKNNAEMNKVKVVGCPRFDYLVNSSFNHDEILKKYNLPNKNIILLATTQMMTEFYKNDDLLGEVIKSLGLSKGTIFVIKPHPSENITKYEKLLDRFDINNGVILQNADLNELIYISNLVITYPSTGPLHSMILQKRTILFGVDTIYSGYSEFVNITNVGDVHDKLTPLLDSSSLVKVNYDNVLSDFFYKIDGKATDRVVELIHQLQIPTG